MKNYLLALAFLFISNISLATDYNWETEVSLNQVCDKEIKDNSFRHRNQTLCAENDRLGGINIPLAFACLNRQFQKNSELCPEEFLVALDFPELPYKVHNFPVWPVHMKPVIAEIYGTSLVASKKVNLPEALQKKLYDQEVIKGLCINTPSFAKTDRVLCGPYLNDLALEDAFSPDHKITVNVYFDSGKEIPTDSDWYAAERDLQSKIAQWGTQLQQKYGIDFKHHNVRVVRVDTYGHADKSGNRSRNYQTSVERAQSASNKLYYFFAFNNYLALDNTSFFPMNNFGRGDEDAGGCWQEAVDYYALCVTETPDGWYRGDRSGGRRWNQRDSDRCQDDYNGRSGWIYPTKEVCSENDRRAEMQIQLRYVTED